MDTSETKAYQKKLREITEALESCDDAEQKSELLSLRSTIEELLSLTDDVEDGSTKPDNLDAEIELFMNEMEEEGVEITRAQGSMTKKKKKKAGNVEVYEGMKCQAPHKHSFGQTVYHNAMIAFSTPKEDKVKVLFMNPTHLEMLPCPFYFESGNCVSSDEDCRFSHGELVEVSKLKPYKEPNFDALCPKSRVLAQKDNKLWYYGIIERIIEDRALIKFDEQQSKEEINLGHIFPLEQEQETEELVEYILSEEDDAETLVIEDSDDDCVIIEDNSPKKLGEWEKHTKGIGSKLMAKMGYVAGFGLGKRCDGRIEPVAAVVLPPGKSLDHCMELREQSGGKKDFYSPEKRLKPQKPQIKKPKTPQKPTQDVFTFLNETLKTQPSSSGNDRLNPIPIIRNETTRNLNVASLQIDETIRKYEVELKNSLESLERQTDRTSQVFKRMAEKCERIRTELGILRKNSVRLRREQGLRKWKEKMGVF